jgi:hypothetical protein
LRDPSAPRAIADGAKRSGASRNRHSVAARQHCKASDEIKARLTDALRQKGHKL